MKFKNLKKCLMAHLLALTIASPAALAMPTGGDVVVGDITGITAGELANNTTLTVNDDSFVNWSDFSIGLRETLNIALGENTMVNYVTSDKMSQLLGTLNANGTDGSLFMLINPNGIVVGPAAEINASQMVLSSLDLGSDPKAIKELDDLLTQNTLTLKSKNGKGITLDKGAKLSTESGVLHLIGNVIEIADDVVIKAGDNAGDFSCIAAVNGATLGFPEGENIEVTAANATTGNTLTIGKAEINAGDIGMAGGKVTINGATINANDTDEGLEIYAANKLSDTDDGFVVTADSSNSVAINNGSTLNANGELVIAGGSVAINKSTINGTALDDDVRIFAAKEFAATDDDTSAIATDQNKISIIDSTIKTTSSSDDIAIIGGKVSITNSAIDTTKGDEITIIAASKYEDSETNKQTVLAAGATNDVTIKDSTIKANSDAVIWGGKVDLAGNTKVASDDQVALAAATELVDKWGESDVTVKTSENSTITIAKDVTVTGAQNAAKGTPLATGHTTFDKSGKLTQGQVEGKLVSGEGTNDPEPNPQPTPTPIEPDKDAEEVLKEQPAPQAFGDYVKNQSDQSAEKATSIIKAIVDNPDATPAQKEAYVKEVINNNTTLATKQTDTQNQLNSDAAAPAPVAASDTATGMDTAAGADAAGGSDAVTAPAESGSSDSGSQSEDGNNKNS